MQENSYSNKCSELTTRDTLKRDLYNLLRKPEESEYPSLNQPEQAGKCDFYHFGNCIDQPEQENCFPEKTLIILNKILQKKSFSSNDIIELLEMIREISGNSICFVDFSKFTNQKLRDAIQMKERAIRISHYEEMAKWRDKEVECKLYIDFLTRKNIRVSSFFFYKGLFWFMHLGNGFYDNDISTYLQWSNLFVNPGN